MASIQATCGLVQQHTAQQAAQQTAYMEHIAKVTEQMTTLTQRTGVLQPTSEPEQHSLTKLRLDGQPKWHVHGL